jgi:hypothetical protein
MRVTGAQKLITEALTSWEGVTVQPHRFPGTVRQDRCGGVEYVMGKREVGHIHGDGLADIPFPKKVRDKIVGAGRAQPHHILPETGWVSFTIRQKNDVEKAIALLRESYEIAIKQKSQLIEVNDEQ